MKLCKLCGESKKLVKSHIIPEAFWREIRQGDDAPLLISSAKGQFPKKAPIGVYDDGILCTTCEESFGHVDDYGITVLLKKRDELFQPYKDGAGTLAYVAEGVDQQALLKFFISVLWRASVSSHSFYKRISIGEKHEEFAKEILHSKEIFDSKTFGAVLSGWRAEDKNAHLSETLMDPFRERLHGLNAYRFYFGKFTAHIKVDQRSFQYPFKSCALGADTVLAVISRNFSKSKEFQVMRSTAIKSHRNVAELKAQFSARKNG